MMRLVRARDEGITVVELLIAALITAILGGMMISWIMGVSNSDKFHRESNQALDEMRTAKARLVKELRFAHAVSTDPLLTDAHKVTVWIDDPVAGTVGTPDAGIGEFVTWEITADGKLTRSTDVAGSSTQLHATGLVYDALAAPGSSAFGYPTAEIVTIALVADVNSSTGPQPQSIQTQVRLRNA